MASNPDVIVVGGGIAGLAAALRLQDKGLQPLVLEAAERVGGRMTSDRVNGFVIDRGVTLLGRRFTHMHGLARRFSLRPKPVAFTLGLEDKAATRRYRARRLDDVLLDTGLSTRARIAFGRMAVDMLRHRQGLTHGSSDHAWALDDVPCQEYFDGLGAGGQEVFDRILEPGLRAAVGGTLASVSRAILFQTIWNTLGSGFWNLEDGVDRLPEAIAQHVPVLTGARVCQVRYGNRCVEVEIAGQTQPLQARAAILAVPGHLVPGLCPQLPDWLAEPLARTRYSSLASVHVALSKSPSAPFTGYGFVQNPPGLGVLEFEHLRAPGRCPPGTGMISVYLTGGLDQEDQKLQAQAICFLEKTFPETAGRVMFSHVIRWPIAIALFPTGRLREMVQVRRQLALWRAPLDLCGDYLDGLSSEGALCTGEQAAERLSARL